MEAPDVEFRIRSATPEDRSWILPLVPRLHAFGPSGPPPWRPVPRMDAAESAVMTAALAQVAEQPADAAVLVAEDAGADGATPLGFVHLITQTDYFTGEPHGHVSILVVSPEGEGRGIGRALLAASEAWARERGYALLSLNVFEGNRRARALYDRAGYTPETIKMVKVLTADPADPRR